MNHRNHTPQNQSRWMGPALRTARVKIRKRGLTSLEVFASATILMSLIAVSSLLIIRSARISKETRLRMIALQEVANALHTSLATDQSECPIEPKNWPLSKLVSDFWPDAQMESQRIQDGSGEKIQLTLFFDEKRELLPIRLVGWRSTKTNALQQAASTGEQP
jgi:hypothetical protein